jgi:hypothetical protein
MKVTDFRLQIPALVALLALTVPTGAARKKHEPDADLCSLKTVYVEGNSQSATAVRDDLGKRTWLKLENDRAKAEAVLAIQETRTRGDGFAAPEDVRVTGEIRRDSKLLWSGSAGGAGSFASASAKAVAWQLLRHLNKDAGCK